MARSVAKDCHCRTLLWKRLKEADVTIVYKTGVLAQKHASALDASTMQSIYASLLPVMFLGWTLHDGAFGYSLEQSKMKSKMTEIREISPPKANVVSASSSSNCFPAVAFTMPSSVPSSLSNWWCNTDTEYGFVGFSYEVTACKCPVTSIPAILS